MYYTSSSIAPSPRARDVPHLSKLSLSLFLSHSRYIFEKHMSHNKDPPKIRFDKLQGYISQNGQSAMIVQTGLC